jgi:hypothetical protein
MQVVDAVITLDLETAAFDALPPIDPERWPERA